MNEANQKWETIIDSLKPILSEDFVNLLKSCELSQEKQQWFINAPNQFAISTLEKKVLPTLGLALEKYGIQKFKLRVHEPDIFDEQKNVRKTGGRQYKSNLNIEYQFDNFVVGQSNDNAYAAAKRVSEGEFNPQFNPLLIYGGTGLGKSHLMHAVGNALRANGRNRVIYLTAEEFTNDFIAVLQEKKSNMQEFNEYYRSADALLIDDVQFLGGKERSQTEFFHTFNSLFDRHCPIILTCDRFPKEIDGLEPRLQSRFGQGSTVSVVPPDLETRIAILHNKADRLNFHLPDDVALYIAEQVVSNVRDLEGALKNVYMRCQIRQLSAPDIRLAREALGDLIKARSRQISLENIHNVVARHYKITPEEMISKSRKANIVLPRQIGIHLARKLTQHSTTEIAQYFNVKDHTTVLHACNKINEKLDNDSAFNELHRGLEMTITG